MPDRSKDELAKALEQLASGEAHDSQAGAEHRQLNGTSKPASTARAASPTRPSTPARPVAPGSTNQSAPQRPAAPARPQSPSATSAAPRSLRPDAPAARAAATPPARPPAPASARPAAPAGAVPPARPTTPQPPRPAQPVSGAPLVAPAAADNPPVDEDDAVIVPAPDVSVFLHKPDYATKPKPSAFGQGVEFRRTFIPILLTGGVILLGLGALHFGWNAPNNPMRGLPAWLAACLCGFGLVLWGLAIVNMMVVNHMLQARKQTEPQGATPV